MRKFISAVTSAAMAATMVSSLAPAVVNAADATKGLSIQTYSAADSKYASDGSSVKVSAADIAAGDVVIPCAVYLDEATPSSEAISIQLSVDGPDAKGIKFDMYESTGNVIDGSAYFSEEKEFTAAGETFSQDNPVTFAGEVDKWSGFTAAGSSAPACKQGLKAANLENYYIGYSWTTGGYDYTWSGSKSTDFPVFVFDVTIPKGTKAGDYTIDFLTYDTSKDGKGNPATMIETKERYTKDAGNLTLKSMNITVDGNSAQDKTTTTTTKTVTQTTTKTTTKKVDDPDPNADVIFDFGTWEANPGDTVEVPVTIDSQGNPVISVDCEIDVQSPIELTAIGKSSPAFNKATVTGDPTTKCLNFASFDAQGKARTPKAGAVAFVLTFTVPENCPAGEYNIGFGSKCDVNKDNGEELYKVGTKGGTIKVNGDVTSTTTATVTNKVTSTTTKKIDDTDAQVVFDFGEWNAEPGQQVEVPVTIDSNGNPVISVDCEIDVQSPIELTAIGKSSPAFNKATVTGDPTTKCLNFASFDAQGKARTPKAGAVAFVLTFTVPENCPAGDYTIGFGSKCDVNKDNGEELYTVGTKGGIIHVGGTTTSTTTVTTTKTTTATTTTTTPPVGKKVPNWGDTNEDGSVKVNDVVILNRFLNSTMDLSDQAKVNADCCDPQDPTGGAVDPAKVDLSMNDSNAILQRCVHLIELPKISK